jgi:hypothetical protein
VNSDVINCLVLWEAMRKKEMLFIFVCGVGGEECVGFYIFIWKIFGCEEYKLLTGLVLKHLKLH